MVPEAPPQSKIPTKNPQPARPGASRPAGPARGGPRSGREARAGALLRGDARAATRGDGRVVIELECGVTVEPARGEVGRLRGGSKGGGGRRRCPGATEDQGATK